MSILNKYEYERGYIVFLKSFIFIKTVSILLLMSAAISQADTGRMKILYYNENQQSSAVGEIDEQNHHDTIYTYPSGFFSRWTHIVSGDLSTIFYYNKSTGEAALGSINNAGEHDTTASFGPGYFANGWSHIVYHGIYLFFYNHENGAASIGEMTDRGYKEFTAYPPNTFSHGWTHIVSEGGYLFFYNADHGSGAVGDWVYTYSTSTSGFASVIDVNFQQLIGYPANVFSPDWSHVVGTNNGLLFYRASDGLQVMASVEANGNIRSRAHTVYTLRSGWTHIVATREDVLFYDADNGDAAVGEVQGYDPDVIAASIGRLYIKRELSGVFSPGWTHLTDVFATGPPIILR